MRVTTLMKHILEPNQDKKLSLFIGGKQYELGKAFVTEDKKGDNGAILEYGRVILCAGEPIVEKSSEPV